ncbi:uncharacterized protein LOC142236371 [Haematobia irritans]|uniref:uncharacterized protein LOC142236371 n=1 Tax=Haematobia irritans TaxID=7368 RepID=UPI003F50C230
MDYNVRGIQGKKRLKDFKKIIEVLFLASSADGCTELEFTLALSRAIKAAKNKHFKSICLNKKNNKENCSTE